MKKAVLVGIILAFSALAGFAWHQEWIKLERPPSHEQWVLGEFTVNLQPRNYLRTRVVLEYVDNREARRVVNSSEAQARDIVIRVLREHSVEELRNGDIDDLRERLLTELQDELGLGDLLVTLYFVDFVIQ